MANQYLLSEKDQRRLEEALRWFDRNKNLRDRLHKRYRGSGGGISKVFARIVSTLRREDEVNNLTAIDYYEIELLAYPIADWSASHGTYYVDDQVKYNDKIYICLIEHESSSALLPTATSHWKESSYKKAWVFGYSGDLLEAAPWFQIGDIVEVINYNDSRWPEREWWIMETVIKIADGDKYSLMWNEDENRLMAIYG